MVIVCDKCLVKLEKALGFYSFRESKRDHIHINYSIQLTFEQYGFELHGSIYMWVFKNTMLLLLLSQFSRV